MANQVDTRYFNRTEPTIPFKMAYWIRQMLPMCFFKKFEPIEDEI